MAALVCAKCGSKMEEGVMMDQAHGGPVEPKWAEGRPVPTWFGPVFSKQQHAIVTHRCSRCGYLESYAPAAAGTGNKS